MHREKNKLKENEISDKKLIEIIKEKEIEIKEYKRKLKLAEEEIYSIKKELNNLKQEINKSIKVEVEREDKLEIEEDKDSIPTLVLGEASSECEEINECLEEDNFDENYNFFGDTNIEKNNSEENNDNKNYIEISDELPEESTENVEEISEDINDSEMKNIDNYKVEELYNKNNLVHNDDENTDKNNELFENLKVAFIDNNKYECEKILNLILENINNLENNFTYEESITLIYLSYFYSKLEELLNKSKVMNNYYLSECDEVKLLRKILEEKDYPIYKEVTERICIEIKNNKNLFKAVDTIIKVRILDKINNILYKSFDFVCSINDIEYGEETINIKAWVKEKNGFVWRLVEGLYSKKKEKIYMLDSSIYVLRLNINESIKEEIQSQKNYNGSLGQASIKEDVIVTKEENKSEDIIKDKEDSNEEVIKEKQTSNTIINKEIILEDKKAEVKSGHNKWFNLKEKISLRLKRDNDK